MGNQKQKWTLEEEEALKAGVRKHGAGKWKIILDDTEFAPYLISRSNIDLKDKWRNMLCSTATQGSRDKSRTPRPKAITAGAPAIGHTSASAVPMAEDNIAEDPSENPQDVRDVRNAPRYSAMIFEALSSIKDSNGSDIGAIVGFIEQRYEVPQNFKRSLSTKLSRLVLQGILEKVQHRYKIKDAALGTETPAPKQKEVRSRPMQKSKSSIYRERVKDAARSAARKVAKAEKLSIAADEAVKEAERVSEMAEEAETMLELMKEIYKECSRGKILLLA